MDLSIIIPTYNRNSLLAECLQSLEHNDVEFIVVDDGSPTPVEVPSNVRLLRHERNKGRAAAVNTGLKAASHNLVLIVDDDIYAAPDMVVRMADEFALWNNPKLALVGRVVWDPEVKMTLTMRWLEEDGPFHDISTNRSGILPNLATENTMMWRPFILQHGGFDEKFTHCGLEDIELGLRLKQNGLEIRLHAPAIAYHHKSMRVRDLVQRELKEGLSAVYLHSKFPEYVPQAEDMDSLARNAKFEKEALAAVEEIEFLEEANSSRMPAGGSDLFLLIYRYHFLTGILNGLKERGAVRPSRESAATLSLYNQASQLESIGELSEARRLFRLVRSRQDSEHWAEAEYHLGVIESEYGSKEKARTHFTNCLELKPDHIQARESLEFLAISGEIGSHLFEQAETPPAQIPYH